MSIAHTRLQHRLARDFKFKLMRRRNTVNIEKRQVVIRSVMESTDENGIWRDVDSAFPNRSAHARIVEHLSHGPRIRPTHPAAAGTTVMSGFMRVIHAGGPMAKEKYHAGKSCCQSNILQNPLGNIDHLLCQKSVTTGFW